MIRERRGCRGKVQRAMLSKLIRKHLQANMKQNKNIIVWILFWRSLGARIHCRMLGLALVPRYFPAFSHFPWQECKGQCSKSPPVAGVCSLGLSENRIIFKMRRGCGANGNGLASTVETWSSLFACLFGACLHWYFMHRLAQEVLIFLGDTRSSQCFPRVVLFFVVFFGGFSEMCLGLRIWRQPRKKTNKNKKNNPPSELDYFIYFLFSFWFFL